MNKRVTAIRKLFDKNKIDALFVTHPADIFYITGLSQFIHPGDAYVIITSKKVYLVTSVLYSEGISRSESFELCILNSDHTLKDVVLEVVALDQVQDIGAVGNYTSVALYNYLSKSLGRKMIVVGGLVEEIRKIKDPSEMSKIKKACKLSDQAYEFVLKNLKVGVCEKEIAFKLEMFIRERGGELAFPIIAAFGSNGATPHHENSDLKLSKDVGVVLLDFGASVSGYASDITRTVFVGTPSDAVSSTYDTLLEIQEGTIKYAKKQDFGSRLSEIAIYCARQFEEASLPPIPHLLGHGLGIEIHEEPRVGVNSDDMLAPGLVFTVEPGVYVPGHLGMRIEDTVGVEENSVQVFTKSSKKRVVISI